MNGDCALDQMLTSLAKAIATFERTGGKVANRLVVDRERGRAGHKPPSPGASMKARPSRALPADVPPEPCVAEPE